MTSAQRVWISRQAHERLQRELATLRGLCHAAATEGGTGAGTEEDQQKWQERIQQIHDLLVDVTVGQDPPDDGIAEPGMVLTIRYHDTGAVETFLLGVRSAEHGDIEVYSIQSPLGAALAGARPGERRTYSLPNGKPLTVTLLNAVPYAMHDESTSEKELVK
ncbi:transcription elongation factor GreAB [Mycobacterium asiaticum]|uniref:Transcription elongation factor GreAB n=1 Tax=Mycobacterium asiaticum TaxID=1790 RepID=A0A1A3NZM1_MYCAS|nr:GreA/GreB family elongation factor [Mycobacterium asiaticum]OBK25797.1 transcription elongation factor GreAB [Mycobacterium asiaticum]